VLFDVTGRQVRRLAHGTYTAGAHDLAWDGRDASGRPMAPGVYLARLKGTHTNTTEHLVLMQ
jgi:flagellar hook assembly protein FlgD